MAKVVKKNGLLPFRKSQTEQTRTGQAEESGNKVESKPSVKQEAVLKELSPFERAKMGAGDIFLATDMIPLRFAIN
jgi:hypothetical protein